MRRRRPTTRTPRRPSTSGWSTTCSARRPTRAGTNLPNSLGAENQKKLRKHLAHVTKVPSCVCFQCGFLLYPDAAKTIKVRNITDKGQCRAYRVFAHYINKMQRTTGNTVFKCEVQGTAAMVFACNYCVRQCLSKENGQTVYDQVLPSQLDFFDGVRADGSYTSIGIGDE